MSTCIVIPVFNRLVFTRICVAQLRATLEQRDDVEVVIVDNGSTDGTRQFVEELAYPFRTARRDRNLGFAAACNLGAELARSEILVFLNNDTVPLPGWLNPLERMLLDDGVGVVGSKLLFPDDTIQHAGVVISESRIPVHAFYQFPGNYPAVNRQRDYQAVTGACMAVRRERFLGLGGFDDGYHNSFEDVDLCLRAKVNGYRVVYCPTSTLYHFESVSEGRHDHDDSNVQRLISRWGDVLQRDEELTYRQDGFETIPRLPARQLSQAISQLRFERRSSRVMYQAIETLTNRPHGASANALVASNSESADEARASVPCPARAAVLPVELRVTDQQASPASGETAIRFEWRLRRTDMVFLSGLAGRLPATRAEPCILPFGLPVPSVPGSYALVWLSVEVDRYRIFGRQLVEVAADYDFSCRSFFVEPLTAGRRYRVPVVLSNRGASTWFDHGRLMLSYHWYDSTGQHCVEWDGARTPVEGCVSFGEETALDAIVIAPARTGPHLLRWDLVRDGERWLSLAGSSTVDEHVEIQSSIASPALLAGSSAPSIITDDLFARMLRVKERTIAGLESALANADAVGQQNTLQAQVEIITTQKAELTRLDKERTRLELELARKSNEIDRLNADVGQLRALIGAIERGRVMRLLNALGRLRRGPEPPAANRDAVTMGLPK